MKVSALLWIILILHPGHTSLFLETVIKFMGRRGPEKQIPLKEKKIFFRNKRNLFYFNILLR